MSARSTTVLSVTELTLSIKKQLESDYSFLTLQGEISNFKPNSSGHLYFDLKDHQSKISAVMFRREALNLKSLPKEGDHVVVAGSLSLYPPHGKYQIIVTSLQLQGVGALLIKFEELKKKLMEKGWFEKEHKKPLPAFPKKIGVVTSPTGSVIQDIIHILSRRASGFQLLLYPVKVQGEGAANEIAQAIDQINLHSLVDVLIVGRGGGSLEDLWAFNEEVVAESIFRSKIPIISAVGHETDTTLSDFVADVRAPTPSAAAELVMKATLEHVEFIEKMKKNLEYTLLHLLKRSQERLARFSSHSLIQNPYTILSPYHQKMDGVQKDLDRSVSSLLKNWKVLLFAKEREKKANQPTQKLHFIKEKLKPFGKRLDTSFQNALHMKRQRIKEIVQTLASLDPKNVLKRGYSILFDLNEGSVIESAATLKNDQKLKALLKDGSVEMVVRKGDHGH